MKIVSLIGARPQYIKEAIMNKELLKRGVEEIIVDSGQHYDFNMSDVFFKTLQIKPPDYSLGVGSGKHGEMTGKIMIKFERLLSKIMPEMVLVYGDTNTTLAGALVASKLNIPVAHIEAGIRMKPKNMPEEINRVVVDHLSTLLFCPSRYSTRNLKKEGIIHNVQYVGDVMYDLFLKLQNEFNYEVYEKLNLQKDKYILFTMHRDYNVDNHIKLENILKEIRRINERIQIVFPIHPRTSRRIEEYGFQKYIEELIIIPPCDYLNLMGLLKNSYKVVTDSGGLQKEAYFANKHSAVLMPDTGWKEIIDNKCGTLCDENNIEEALFINQSDHNFLSGIYGNGKAGEKIARSLVSCRR